VRVGGDIYRGVDKCKIVEKINSREEKRLRRI
jgi:hypothetical protein